MPKIAICLLTNERGVHYLDLHARVFAKLPEYIKNAITIYICPSFYSEYLIRLFQVGIECHVLTFPDPTYINKIKTLLELPHRVFVKLDDDCFMGPQNWVNLLSASHHLENSKVQLVSPLISTNIPHIDLILPRFLVVESRSRLEAAFLGVKFPESLWGTDYSSLNKFTVYSDTWNAQSFYTAVGNLETPFKGIHPIRISLEGCVLLFNYFLNNFHYILGSAVSECLAFKAPYFTNNLFMIKRETWLESLSYPSDGYDEIPLSLMCTERDMVRAAILGGVCLHPMYNTIHSYDERGDFGLNGGRELESRMAAALSIQFMRHGI